MITGMRLVRFKSSNSGSRVLASIHSNHGFNGVLPLARLQHNVIPVKNERVTGFLFHVNNLHRSQHQLAHSDTGSKGKVGSGNSNGSASQGPPAGPSAGASQERKSFHILFYERLLKFLESYQKMLYKKFPGTMHVYRVFIDGFKDFTIETKDYVMIQKRVILSPEKVQTLSKKEIDIYFRMPRDLARVGPVLLISALPFANYIVFPIAYYFPRHLLSSHFWSLQQKAQFAIEFQKERLQHYRSVFRHLQLNLEDIKDASSQALVQELLHKLGSGSHPTIREIMAVKHMFELGNFSHKAIHGPHVKALCRAHGIHTLYLSRRRLYDRAVMLQNMDIILLREGLYNLKTDELKNACFIRGLNAANASHEDLMEYLQQWMSISTSVQPHAYSLLLHLPILLTYNHPNNWALLKSK